MSSKFIAALLIFFVFSLFSIAANAKTEVSPPPKEGTVLTNEDLEKYKKPSDGKVQEKKVNKAAEKKEKAEKTTEHEDKEYWCKKAAYYKKKIEKAQNEVNKQEGRLEELKEDASEELGNKRKLLEKEIKKTQNKLKTARKLLKDRQKDLERIEDEAHKKGIPAGWLRCQFTW